VVLDERYLPHVLQSYMDCYNGALTYR
jgi:hypothetical protein